MVENMNRLHLHCARTIRIVGHWSNAAAHVTLSYDDRFLRRKVLTTDAGERFLVDLPQTMSLNHGDAFELTDGRLIEVIAANEDLLEITGENLLAQRQSMDSFALVGGTVTFDDTGVLLAPIQVMEIDGEAGKTLSVMSTNN